MKTKIGLAAILFATALSSCGTKQQLPQKNNNPFGEVYSMPCEIYDTQEKFAATGIYKGSSNQKGQCHLEALANAKAIIREKFHSAYKGMISDYSSTIGNNNGNDIATKLERAGDQVLDIVLNDALESCSKFSAVDDRGMVECYVAIEIYKEDLSKKVAREVSDNLTNDEKASIHFDEENYRQKMQDRLQNFKQAQ